MNNCIDLDGTLRTVHGFGDSLAAGLKELGKKGYIVKDIKDIKGGQWSVTITKDLLVFVERSDNDIERRNESDEN